MGTLARNGLILEVKFDDDPQEAQQFHNIVFVCLLYRKQNKASLIAKYEPFWANANRTYRLIEKITSIL